MLIDRGAWRNGGQHPEDPGSLNFDLQADRIDPAGRTHVDCHGASQPVC